MSQSDDYIIEALSNHIALPPRLPGYQDENIDEIEIKLIHRMLDATKYIMNNSNSLLSEEWKSLYRSLSFTKIVNENGGLSKASIISALQDLCGNDFILFHVNEQNAGITVRLQNSEEGKNFVFEVSEASPKSEDVLASDVLLWEFPSSALTLPVSSYHEYDLKDELATFLAQASNESIKQVAAHTKKAESQAFESRNTVNPVIISGILMTILKSRGKQYFPPLLKKRIRDDVCWDRTAVNPWRRSPLWLLLRVAIERHLRFVMGWDLGHLYYKLLMCLFYSNFISRYTASSQIKEEVLQHLLRKLVVRIDKLNGIKILPENKSASQFIELQGALEKIFENSIECAAKKLSSLLSISKNTQERSIQRIPFHAPDYYCKLKLFNSEAYIKDVMRSSGSSNYFYGALDLTPEMTSSDPKLSSFTHRCLSIMEHESNIETELHKFSSEDSSHKSLCNRCQTIAQLIERYLKTVKDFYDDNPEQKSRMLLLILELWIELDKCAIQLYSLLKKFDCGIPQEITNFLLLPRLEDLKRLQKAQNYLINRKKESDDSSSTIFDQPSNKCFAVQFYDSLPGSSIMKKSRLKIEEKARKERELKKIEWMRMNKKYKSLEEKESITSHEFIDGMHEERLCSRCHTRRAIRRLKIDIHEWPLPSNSTQLKAVMFELQCPKAFSVYRDISWMIIADLASISVGIKEPSPEFLLHDYDILSSYATTSRSSNFTLASKAKLFTKTHYRTVKFPAREIDVCLPNGAKFQYFDAVNLVWPTQPLVLSFAQHCGLVFPKESPYSLFAKSLDLSNDKPVLSSYSVIASRPRCPVGVLVQEFLSMQTLLLGYEHRWFQILIELGSSNINFCTESATHLMNFLVLQVGPRDHKDIRGITHRIFLDHSFCNRLIYWINWRLDEISSTVRRREVFCMEILITLAVRLFEIGGPKDRDRGFNLVAKARDIVLKWLLKLKKDIDAATTFEKSQVFSHYATWAALLCRRTFIVFTGSSSIPHTLISSYLESSICLQANLCDSEKSLSFSLKAALIRDSKIVWDIRHLLCASINMQLLTSIISHYIPSIVSTVNKDQTSDVSLTVQENWFIHILTEESIKLKKQDVALNLLSGHLLVNNKETCNLTKEWRESGEFRRLFGSKAYQIRDSNRHGMEYTFSRLINGHEVHLGTRNGKKIIQVFTEQCSLEYLPLHIFMGDETSDLPTYLLTNYIHWLNLKTGCINICHTSNPWKHELTDWVINFINRTGSRQQSLSMLYLIDPYSPIYKAIARIFKGFEKPSELFIFQENNGGIKVFLPRLELRFQINENQHFECSELRSEIDPDQDVGTWYDLKSKLVLRGIARVPNTQNRFGAGTRKETKIVPTYRRTILVPTGDAYFKKDGPYVEVRVYNTGSYARFLVNDVLGRIDPADPSDQYLKAYYHAVTSRLNPDSLTGRTGTEEAIHCLNSAYCQPNVPLSPSQKTVLQKIANLTPHREFYPKNMEVMQETSWNKHLTTSIQYEGFRAIVDRIWERSQQLSQFSDSFIRFERFPSHKIDRLPGCGVDRLNKRNLIRRDLYVRRQNLVDSSISIDKNYFGHNTKLYTTRLASVQMCIELIQNWSQSLPTTKNLDKILEKWVTFQGFCQPWTEFLISDLIDITLSEHWGSLVNTMRSYHQDSKYKIMFILGIISFNEGVNMDIVITLIAFAISDKLKALEPPHCLFYQKYKKDERPTVSILLNLIHDNYNLKEGSQKKIQARDLVDNLLEQWPCAEPYISQSQKYDHLDVDKTLDIIRPEWLRMFQNYELSIYLKHVQRILNDLRCDSTQNSIEETFEKSSKKLEYFPRCTQIVKLPGLISHLLSYDLLHEEQETNDISIPAIFHTEKSHIPLLGNAAEISKSKFSTSPDTNLSRLDECFSSEILALRNIIENLSLSNSVVQQQYAKDLLKSLNSLQTKDFVSRKTLQLNLNMLPLEIKNVKQITESKLKMIRNHCDSFMPTRSKWLKKADLWPYITPVSLLESLQSKMSCKFGYGIRECIIEYAVSITRLQQLYRIHEANVKGDNKQLSEEIENLGHENWDPISHPDWLLLEVDGNFLIRPSQVDVAREIICPATGNNSVLQMNMGQGKTSCIMPMAAATLADGNSLTRVIVPRALLAQTINLLQTRLGGLVGREVKHIPFSRKLSKKPNIANSYLKQLRHIQENSGIIVTLPEHILSFKLSGQQALSERRGYESKYMFEVQKWISERSRDIIDECDEILSIRTQLIYPSGTQSTIDGHPYRWEIIETLLWRVNFHVNSLENKHLQSINVSRRNNSSFPFLCFIKVEAEELLKARIVDDVCSGITQTIPKYCSRVQRIIRDFISIGDVSDDIVNKIDSLNFQNQTRQALYLLRGLLGHGILVSSLKKRWNVQYGLHPQRDPIAVPYHAKGCPSDQSEWGHPDVAIILTCLSFYYEGMTLKQFNQTLKYVCLADDPVQVYHNLIQQCSSLPDSFQDWNNINTEDEAQVNQLWRYLNRDFHTINFFLNKVIFPRYAKQFEYKLQATSWDIPALSLQNDTHQNVPLTTGFSGTNDWKGLLPLTISQQDLTSLLHTNAEVLTYLLQERNLSYIYAADSSGKRFTELNLLQAITKYNISVLIDAGAQIMEMDNLSLVRAWLDINVNAPAALYFDQDNKPQILYKNGGQAPFYSSTFSDNLEGCLVYLDQVHTRGTDLKLPPSIRGALTLGPNQTKDHTVQAAMRLRQLGSTQSVMFFAPPEVHQSILILQGKKQTDKLTSHDVVSWLLKQSCLGIELLLSLYCVQGYQFCRRYQASLTYPNLFDSTSSDREKFLSVIRPNEDRTLVELYGTKKKRKLVMPLDWDPEVKMLLKQLKDRCKYFINSNVRYYSSALQEVEQEREVAHEVQTIRQLQLPVSYIYFKFPGLHQEILNFVIKGRITADANGYESAFDFIARTLIGKKYGINKQGTSQKLFVSAEFGRTVSPTGVKNIDHLHRPVHWILWSPLTEVAMIIIPEEVEIIISLLQERSCVAHLLTYAAPITRKMLFFNDFDHFNLPSLPSPWLAPMWLRIEVGILAGRLYFDYSEYPALIDFLGVCEIDGKITECKSNQDKEFPTIQSAINLRSKKSAATKGFTSKPLCFLQEWLALRGQGQDFSHTPMGFICQGRSVLAQNPSCNRVQPNVNSINETDDPNHNIYDQSLTTKLQEVRDDLLGFIPVNYDDVINNGVLDDFNEEDLLPYSSDSDSDLDTDTENEKITRKSEK
ncbi:putative p-loop containing nucleoside triphosphate hydrolase [Erysiphe neolycopersici]|uniref:ubiquitinyl hydrolase 1 n=1 Tax=Erysiphe neolycopersici TaxID=212602 RepID=A0A420I7V5_9PEZI|nr:putative p-loop containing nucleoside triphosphate hydrolase [Erysiphe neolycopersici]